MKHLIISHGIDIANQRHEETDMCKYVLRMPDSEEVGEVVWRMVDCADVEAMEMMMARPSEAADAAQASTSRWWCKGKVDRRLQQYYSTTPTTLPGLLKLFTCIPYHRARPCNAISRAAPAIPSSPVTVTLIDAAS